ncbi:beta-lactamase family protein [Lysobacter sp. 5GHs7-4]|uniref:serine hydrolase domain-containing protein n=1 Tax=Lysobacter sp. 5GHs7-4 TaxID=2904253 RepID=UPI001E28F566|nr:serine hydrolase domain-containing protein [Lysobacter sp. 5GHs7-4]UHQ24606.1 beta-lactamase family protein [Lysobacter sp. 5GHs7-4]
MKAWILSLLLLSPAAIAAPASAVPAASPTLDAFVADYARQHDFSGTVLVTRDGRNAYAGSFGDANRVFGVPNTPQTRYKIASITKTFTAVLILQLRDEGRLDLERRIGDYLPDYAGEGARRVSVHQLLNHSSGLANLDTVKDAQTAIRDGLPVYQLPHTSDALLARYCAGRLSAEPGRAFDYNNCDYIVLGKIVERVTGQDYEQALRERILRPLGLADTGLLRQDRIVERLADTYFARDGSGAMTPDLPAYPENWYAAGAMYSSAQDLARFAEALYGGRLLSADSLARMLRPGLDDYGYGLWSYTMKFGERTYRVVKRPGQIMGARSQLLRVIEPRISVVILGNAGSADLDEFAAAIARRAVAQASAD